MKEFLEYDIFDIGNYHFTVFKTLMILAIIIITYLITWSLKKIFKIRAAKMSLKEGRWWAYYQISKYFLWVIAISLILETIGIKITFLIASSAALFVGIGLGMQQVFNDMVSGLILLFEGSVTINDIIDLDGEILKIRRIGARTSEAINRDDIIIIIPNSKLVSNKVINWTHHLKYIRFIINIGVAYGSDVDLVIKILEEAATENKDSYKQRKPVGRLINFGESSLDFELLFWSTNMFRIKNTASDIRRNIIKKFDANNIQIPFPQRDVHLKK
jgi:small-conductance mechanosensitive channel